MLASTPVPAAPILVGSVSMVLTMTMEDVIYFQGMYGIQSHIRVFAPDPDGRMTSGPEGGIALYEGFLHAGLRLLFHPFIYNFLDCYQLVQT